MFWEILKASKGLPVIDQYAALWGKKIAEADGWKVTEITGELPITFLSDGSVLVDYRIYGTSAGAGVETETKIYGWHVDPSISDPAQAITYLGDAVGKTPAAMGSETFSYGDWSDAFFMPKPCMVKSSGTVDYYLDPNDYSKKADGTASDVANASYDGNAMMEWPLLWWKYEAGEIEGEGYFYVANRKPDDTYHCWCNYDADDNITEHFYTAIYNGTGTSKMRSISGVALTSANGNGGTTAAQEITRATANNTTDKTEWYIDVWSDRTLINGLLILMGKSLNSQAVFGRGLGTGSQSAKEAYVTGTLNDKGLFWGDISAGTSGVKVFGMENWWGCAWRRTAGLIGLSNGNTAYKLTYGTADGTTADGYNTNGNDYLIDATARPASGYFKTVKFGKFGYLPLTMGGSSTTYYSDYWYTNNSALTFALVGGDAYSGVSAGCSYFHLGYAPGSAGWYISSSLSFKPLAKTISDTGIIPHGYKLPLTVESGEQSQDIPIYIGDSKLGEEEYVDYGGQKMYKFKEAHKDTVTIDGVVWDILGYDQDEAYDGQGNLAQRSVTIQTHDCISELQFDAREALFAFPEGLVAGTYHFTISQQPWYAGDVGKIMQFTLANAIPAGGVIVLGNSYNATMIGSTIFVYASCSATTATETATISEGSDGTDLGSVRNAISGNTNSIQRALLSNNNYNESAIRQYLNSDGEAGTYWTPQTKWDRPPYWAAFTAGFLRGFNSDFISAIGKVSKRTAKNTVSDGGGYIDTEEKIFLPSRTEVYAGDNNSISEGRIYKYYSDYSDLSSAGTGADSNRIKYRNNVAKYWWLRSPHAGYASGPFNVDPSGEVYGRSSATDVYGVAPACCIILDDINANPYLQSLFLKPTDPPAPLPPIPTYKGENTLSSTETLGEVTVKGRIKEVDS